ncbi:MAG TPA: hypothetical protein PLI53_11405 [Geobacteraceae bacterium]|nr:hypothetical protein [Geobacteraceae bacterium]
MWSNKGKTKEILFYKALTSNKAPGDGRIKEGQTKNGRVFRVQIMKEFGS